MPNSNSPGSKASRARWNKENYKSITANIKKSDYEKLKLYAESNNTSISALIKNFVYSLIE